MGLSSTASAAGVGSVAQLSEFVPLTDTTVTVAGSLAILVLIALSAFFSSSEIAMFSLARHRVESLVEDGVPGAAVVQELKSDPHRLLITILVGNNIVNIAMSSIATGLFAIYLSNIRIIQINCVRLECLVSTVYLVIDECSGAHSE